jgi:hypothetical protein
MVGLTVVWLLVLVGGTAWAIAYGRPTAREQTSVAQARPTVDAVTGTVAAAAAADPGTVVAVSGFDRVGGCRVTVFRSGARYQRTVTVVTATGAERAVLERVAAALPVQDRARVRGDALPRLTADAGHFVSLTGTVADPGQVRLVVDTGCRTTSPESAATDLTPSGSDPAAALRPAVEAVLAAAGVAGASTGAPEVRWRVSHVPCPSGDTPLATVEAIATLPSATSLDAAIRPATGATAVVADPELVAFRTPSVGVAARATGDGLTVTATSPCP